MKTSRKWKVLAGLTPKGKANYTESELILPALRFLAAQAAPVNTTNLIKHLQSNLKPKGHDAKLLHGRQDTFFSQKVRNLKSHDSLKQLGLVKYRGNNWQITAKGQAFLESNANNVERMLEQGFKPRMLSRHDQYDFSKLLIEEGAETITERKSRKRSQRLKAIVISSYKRDHRGRVFCTVCNFDFGKKYGVHGRGFIEAHHTSPIHAKDVRGEQVRLSDALSKIALVCSNCHRMIHRKSRKMLTIPALRKLVEQHKCPHI